MRRRLLFSLLSSASLCTLLIAPALADNVSITATITGTAPNAQANATVANALVKFATYFNSATPFSMTADISWEDQGASSLGSSASSSASYQNESGKLYINPLDRFVFGDKPGVTTGASYKDFTISLNNNAATSWDYTLATPSDNSKYSLASVLYHEVLHSMGAVAGIGANGSHVFGTPTVWTGFMTDGIGTPINNLTDAQRATAITGGDGALLFNGPDAKAANGGNSVVLYAPATYENGSSDGSHISLSQAGAGLIYPSIPNGVYFNPSNLELSMMRDIGWKTVPAPSSLIALMIGAVPGVLLVRKRRGSKTKTV